MPHFTEAYAHLTQFPSHIVPLLKIVIILNRHLYAYNLPIIKNFIDFFGVKNNNTEKKN